MRASLRSRLSGMVALLAIIGPSCRRQENGRGADAGGGDFQHFDREQAARFHGGGFRR